MVPESYKGITANISSGGMPLKQLHAAARDYGSTWSIDQLHLLLACLSDWKVTNAGSEWFVERAGRSIEEELEEAIVAAVQSQGGKPLPAGIIMSLLPSRFTTSEVQIRKLAKESARLQTVGPGLIAMKRP